MITSCLHYHFIGCAVIFSHFLMMWYRLVKAWSKVFKKWPQSKLINRISEMYQYM